MSAALGRTVLKPCLDFGLNLASPPAPRSWPSSEGAHAPSPSSGPVPRTGWERANPSPEAAAAAMSSERSSPLSATAATRPTPRSRLMSDGTGIIVRQSAVLPGNVR